MGNSAINKIYFGEVKPLPRPDIQSMVIKTTRKVSEQALEFFLKEWSLKAYRIKGFVNLLEGRTVAVQCTFDTIEILPVENNFYPTEIVALTDQFILREWNKAFKQLK